MVWSEALIQGFGLDLAVEVSISFVSIDVLFSCLVWSCVLVLKIMALHALVSTFQVLESIM